MNTTGTHKDRTACSHANCYGLGYSAGERHEYERQLTLLALLRRCAVELQYVQTINCGNLCASSEGLSCIQAVEALCGPMREWPEVK